MWITGFIKLNMNVREGTGDKEYLFCIRYEKIEMLPKQDRIIIISLNIMISALILILDTTVAIAIKNTRQLSTQSYHLSFVLLILDILYPAFGLMLASLITWFGFFGCVVMLLANFVLEFFVIAPNLMILLVIVDRYLHIRYLGEYSTVYTAKRYKLSLLVWTLVSLFIAFLSTTVSVTYGSIKARFMMKGINITVVLISCGIYVSSFVVLRGLRQNEHLTNRTKQITRIAKLYLLITVTTNVFPNIAIAFTYFLHGIISPNLTLYLHLLKSGYAIFNSIMFIYVNKLTRRYLFRCTRRRSRIGVNNDLNWLYYSTLTEHSNTWYYIYWILTRACLLINASRTMIMVKMVLFYSQVDLVMVLNKYSLQ